MFKRRHSQTKQLGWLDPAGLIHWLTKWCWIIVDTRAIVDWETESWQNKMDISMDDFVDLIHFPLGDLNKVLEK